MFQKVTEGYSFSVKVIPRARTSQIVGWKENLLVIRIAAIPDQGKANEALEQFLAKVLGVGIQQIKIFRGFKSRLKSVLVAGVNLETLEKKLMQELCNKPV